MSSDALDFLKNPRKKPPYRHRGPRKELQHESDRVYKRDVLIKCLLSGERFNRLSLMKIFREHFPRSSARDNARILGRHLPVLLKMGILIRVGTEGEFKIRESILRLLEEEKDNG